MSNLFFDHPILNSPCGPPTRHWAFDESGQPTQQIIDMRKAEFITPIPKRKAADGKQGQIVFGEGKGLLSKGQQDDVTSIPNEVRRHVDTWCSWPNPSEWQVAPETARLLQHWRRHKFSSQRPFFCQLEAVEAAIRLTDVAPRSKAGKVLLDHLAHANRYANDDLHARVSSVEGKS